MDVLVFSPPTAPKDTPFIEKWPAFVVIPNKVRWNINVVLIFTSFMATDVKHYFSCGYGYFLLYLLRLLLVLLKFI